MRYYLKFMICAAFFGILNLLTYNNLDNGVQVILLWCFGNTKLLMAEAGNFMMFYFPALFFHVFFGTYIYKHFCSGAIYYFSRCENSSKWFFKECMKLYLYVAGYLCILISSSMICAVITSHIKIHNDIIPIFLYYFLIHSLFLFFTTLCINIVSIIISNSNGFIYIEGVILFCVATFFILGEKMFPEGIVSQDKMPVIIFNPISHIIFSVHSSHVNIINEEINIYNIDFELKNSIILFFILSVIIVIVGRIAVNKHNFIIENFENGEN